MTVFTIEIMQGYAFLPLTIVIIDRTALIVTRRACGDAASPCVESGSAMMPWPPSSITLLKAMSFPVSVTTAFQLAKVLQQGSQVLHHGQQDGHSPTRSNPRLPNTMSAARSSNTNGETVMGSTDPSGRSRGFLNLLFLIYSDTSKGKVPWLLGDIS